MLLSLQLYFFAVVAAAVVTAGVVGPAAAGGGPAGTPAGGPAGGIPIPPGGPLGPASKLNDQNPLLLLILKFIPLADGAEKLHDKVVK